MRSASPAPSQYSVTSSIRAQSYRLEFGRGLNNYSDVYQLPADDEELERLDMQHVMFKVVMGKYPPPLVEILSEVIPGEPKACLDLGCGSGSWIMDVARDFPNCQAVAVDLVPMQAEDMPPNCRSEVDDINLGMQHFYGDFDVVHTRLVSSGVRDYRAFIDEIARVLRPKGLVEIVEFDFRCYDNDHKPILSIPDAMEPPWLPRWFNLSNMAVRQRGGTPDASNMLYAWFRQHPAFEDIVYREVWLPTSAFYQKGHKDFYAGTVMQKDIQAFLKSGRPLLLGSGLPEAYVDEVTQLAHDEVEAAQTVTFCRVESVYARKREAF
ncbi:hypothetical protein HETIRDRAFT_153621 [Heterobasidion irregulare TC 32-1]|uniref:Methyltransferase domain-containing protein n=1 Tax=Heterobasidion irregulare (strain TC 32-1) TaxID=747525 RepID=W4KM84_HETIT|nr:uncharacterized protein HETIRDRAFT_153621 [Heterobasidion irregulare TC 32-1]ETW86799.1 hypothetical protein HETIRDRAFT_153621 [Heterobasidion irregulare TC 32-1]